MKKTICDSIGAGFLIAIGGSVFLACDDRYIGAVLFSVALLCICYLGYYLYTGKIGYFAFEPTGKNACTLVVGLCGNLTTTFFLGLLIRAVLPALGNSAQGICSGKLEQSFIATFVRALFCGILMYLAVAIFKEKKTPIGILFCIPVFILSGFEHSVADMFYFGASGLSSWKIVSFEVAAVLGNTVGSLLLPGLQLLGKTGRGDEKKAE